MDQKECHLEASIFVKEGDSYVKPPMYRNGIVAMPRRSTVYRVVLYNLSNGKTYPLVKACLSVDGELKKKLLLRDNESCIIEPANMLQWTIVTEDSKGEIDVPDLNTVVIEYMPVTYGTEPRPEPTTVKPEEDHKSVVVARKDIPKPPSITKTTETSNSDSSSSSSSGLTKALAKVNMDSSASSTASSSSATSATSAPTPTYGFTTNGPPSSMEYNRTSHVSVATHTSQFLRLKLQME